MEPLTKRMYTGQNEAFYLHTLFDSPAKYISKGVDPPTLLDADLLGNASWLAGKVQPFPMMWFS